MPIPSAGERVTVGSQELATHRVQPISELVQLRDPGSKIKVERHGGKYPVETSSFYEHGHVYTSHIQVDTYKLGKNV